jgi:uncharacterized protein YcbX
MQGESLSEALLTPRGLVGDRAYALIESETGYVVSAKHARKWAAVLQCRASYLANPEPDAPLPPIQIILPDGQTITSDDPDVNRRLSEAVGRSVTLVQHVPENATREANRAPVDELQTHELIRQEPIAQASPPGTFFDHAPIHILTTSTLRRLKDLCPDGQFDERRFRPNLVITPLHGMDFPENTWSGQMLTAASGVALDVIDPSPRCVITTLAQGSLPHQPAILKTVAQYNSAVSATAAPGVLFKAVVGVYAITQSTGLLSHGMELRLSIPDS